MASIQQQPSVWNLAYMSNVWTIQSTTTQTAAIEIEINGTVAAEIRQNHNAAGVAHFDISKVLQSYLEPLFYENIPLVSELDNLSLKYRVRYGDVLDSGAIDWTAYSAVKYITNGYEDWQTLDWNEDPFRDAPWQVDACEVGTANNVRIAQKRFLTNVPGVIKVTDNDYHTLSFFNWIANATIEQWADQPWFVELTFNYANGAPSTTESYLIYDGAGLGPRTAANDLGPYTYDPNNYIGHIGVGPKNLQDAGLWPTDQVNGQTALDPWNITGDTFNGAVGVWNAVPVHGPVSTYGVNIYSLDRCYYETAGAPPTTDVPSAYLESLMYSQTFENIDTCGAFDPVRVSFVNQYGVKDFFTFDKRNTYTVETQRTNYQQVLGSWSSATFSIDPMGRGLRTFSTALKERMTMETDWLTDAESLYLKELYTSPHINLWYQNKWVPAVITSKVYDEKTVARQKLYRYTLEIEYANQEKRQRG